MNRNNRRHFLLVCLFIITLPVAAEEIRLRIWQGFKFSEVPMLKQNVHEFTRQWNSRHTDKIRIDVDQVPFDDMVRKVKMAASADLLPDIAFIDANQMAPVAYGGAALALDTLPAGPARNVDELRKRYVTGAFDTNLVQVKGVTHLYGIPAQTTTLALFWNKRMFRDKASELQAEGLDPKRAPEDWDEFIRYGKVLTDKDRGIYAFGMHNSMWFTMPFINQYGASLVQSDESGALVPALANARGQAAITQKVDLYLRHGIEGGAWREGSLNPDQGFQNEKYAMVFSGPWMIETFRSSQLDFGVAMIPRVPITEAVKLGLIQSGADEISAGLEKLSASSIGGQNLVVMSTCRHPGIALEFALYFTSEKVQRRWANELGQIPVLLAAQENLDPPNFPEARTFIRQVRLSKPLPAIPFINMLETDIFNPEMNLALQGKQQPLTALKNIEAAMRDRILNPLNRAEDR